MPKGLTSDGRSIMTKEEFVGQFELEQELKKHKKNKEVNKKALEGFKEDNEKESKKLNKHIKQTASSKKDEKTNIAQMFCDEFSKHEYTVSIEKSTVTIKNRNATYELKIVKKNGEYEITDYNGTKDAMKNKLISIATECEYKNFTIEPIDKSGLIGLTDNTTFYTAKFTKKKA